jgi:hypothetical protein
MRVSIFEANTGTLSASKASVPSNATTVFFVFI